MDENVAIVNVSQKLQHVTVSAAGGLRGLTGPKGEPGAGLQITGSVDSYSELPNDLTEADAGKAWFNQADGKLYVWSGTRFPTDGQGSQFVGPEGPEGPTGFNPSATVSKSGGTTTITITDKDGTTTANVYDGQELTDGIVTGAANNAVTVDGSILALQTVGTPNIRNDAVTTEKIADGSVVTDSIDDGAVTTSKVANGAITNAKVANNAIGTTQVANDAITKDKIDFSTLTNFAFPVVSTTYTMPFGISCTFRRIGNIVIVSNNSMTGSAFPQNGAHANSEIIPLGFRPAYTVQLTVASDDVRIGNGGWEIQPDGSMMTTGAFDRADGFRISVNGIWLTNDAWPSS